MLNPIYDWIDDLRRCLLALVECAAAGTLPVSRPRASRARASRAQPARVGPLAALSPAGKPLGPQPRAFGWFYRMASHGRSAMSEMQLVLSDPAMGALVGSHPAFGRVIRPPCDMLAVQPHPHLLASQPLPRRARTPRPPRPAPTEEQFRRATLLRRKTAFGPPRRRRRVHLE